MEHRILWTGGWDSTFRVLDLVLNKKKNIQPYYILDERRASTEIEIATMEKIKEMMKELDPQSIYRIKDTIYLERNKIPENKKITKYYEVLKTQSHLGDQYDWLARYTESEGIKNLELCIHVDDTVEGFIKNDVKLITSDNDRYYELVENPSQKELEIFSYYRFPLFDMTKIEMGEIAKESGFFHIMEETWFCHYPYKGKPCGMCNPCRYTKEEGLGRRVPNPTIFMKLNRKVSRKLRGLKRRITR